MKIILSLLSKTFFHFTLLRIFMRSVCYIRKKIKYNCCLNEAVRMSQKEEKMEIAIAKELYRGLILC